MFGALPCIYTSPSLPGFIRAGILQVRYQVAPSARLLHGTVTGAPRATFFTSYVGWFLHKLHCNARKSPLVPELPNCRAPPTPETSTPEMKWRVRDVAASEEAGEEGCFYLLLFGLLQSLNVMAEFECWPQLEAHVLHDDVTAQQHQRFAVNLLKRKQAAHVRTWVYDRTVPSVATNWRLEAKGDLYSFKLI